jgi:hypothetical protein
MPCLSDSPYALSPTLRDGFRQNFVPDSHTERRRANLILIFYMKLKLCFIYFKIICIILYDDLHRMNELMYNFIRWLAPNECPVTGLNETPPQLQNLSTIIVHTYSNQTQEISLQSKLFFTRVTYTSPFPFLIAQTFLKEYERYWGNTANWQRPLETVVTVPEAIRFWRHIWFY